ncbi:hypothetical protein BGP_5950 [Beggiatoa sp. PS]|nr:hypothetical protein BGP_5950 [Beggiatoa sp. PS]
MLAKYFHKSTCFAIFSTKDILKIPIVKYILYYNSIFKFLINFTMPHYIQNKFWTQKTTLCRVQNLLAKSTNFSNGKI